MSSADATKETLTQSTSAVKHITDVLFGGNAGRSLLVLAISLIIGAIIGRLFAKVLRIISKSVGKHADAATDLNTVNRFRRIETWTILSIAVVKVLALILALYFWWVFIHPNGKPTALFGASAVLIIIVGGVFSPLLRDFAFGGSMMAEHWFGVGDLITIEPFTIQGVVERITLRSTRIRGLNGEVIWVANQNIQSVRIAQKGVWTMAIEMFVTDEVKAEKLVEKVNALLPTGPSLVASKLSIMKTDKRSKDLWHVTAIGETAPGREWLLERTAIELLKNIDEKSKSPILITDPVARYADNETERQFARAVSNAKKAKRARRIRPLKPVI